MHTAASFLLKEEPGFVKKGGCLRGGVVGGYSEGGSGDSGVVGV